MLAFKRSNLQNLNLFSGTEILVHATLPFLIYNNTCIYIKECKTYISFVWKKKDDILNE